MRVLVFALLVAAVAASDPECSGMVSVHSQLHDIQMNSTHEPTIDRLHDAMQSIRDAHALSGCDESFDGPRGRERASRRTVMT